MCVASSHPPTLSRHSTAFLRHEARVRAACRSAYIRAVNSRGNLQIWFWRGIAGGNAGPHSHAQLSPAWIDEGSQRVGPRRLLWHSSTQIQAARRQRHSGSAVASGCASLVDLHQSYIPAIIDSRGLPQAVRSGDCRGNHQPKLLRGFAIGVICSHSLSHARLSSL